MDLLKRKYAYDEPKQALNSRIKAHRKYSNFSLHEWIKSYFQIMPGDKVFDLGCGDGNYTRLLWKKIRPNGYLLGLDKNLELLKKANTHHMDLPEDKVQFICHDFDYPLPIKMGLFDWIFAIYSLYYAEDSMRLIREVKKMLFSEGHFIVIGPGPDNIKELTLFNHRLTGNEGDGKRMIRISDKFLVEFRKIFRQDEVQYEEINSEMRFPNVEAFAEYYWATLIWRESIQGKPPDEISRLQDETLNNAESEMDLRIRKQISVLIGKRGKS